jgi:hypothetical protein
MNMMIFTDLLVWKNMQNLFAFLYSFDKKIQSVAHIDGNEHVYKVKILN